MQVWFLDPDTSAVHPASFDMLRERIQEPRGIVLLLSAFHSALNEAEKRLEQELPDLEARWLRFRGRRFQQDAPGRLAERLMDALTAADDTVVASVDQPWHTLHFAFEQSAELTALFEDAKSMGAGFTCAYVCSGNVTPERAAQRYRRWLGDCAALHRMGGPERRVFFSLPEDAMVSNSQATAEWIDRLRTCRSTYCNAFLRSLAAAFEHLEAKDDRPSWRFLALAVADDFMDKAHNLEATVLETMQPLSPGWGGETFEGKGLGQAKSTARALGLLVRRERLSQSLVRSLEALAPSEAGLSPLVAWRTVSNESDATKLGTRVPSVERILREARNRLVHQEGGVYSALLYSSIEHVIVALEELAEMAKSAMPQRPSRWHLGNARWMVPIKRLDWTGASTLSSAASRQRHARLLTTVLRRQPSSSQQCDALGKALEKESLGSSKTPAALLLSSIAQLDKRDIDELMRSTDWGEWQHLTALKPQVQALCGSSDS